MYAVIDRTNMAFVAKHLEHRLLSMWSFITLPHVAVTVLPADDPKCFDVFTDLELRLLIKHTTGTDHTNAYRPSMLAACASLGAQLPMLEGLNGFDLDRQYHWIKEGDERRYAYVPGSAVPQLMPDLWEPNPIKCEQRWDASQLQALQRLATAAAPVAPASPRSPATPPATPVRKVPPPPRGSLRDVVWNEMDKVWGEAGKPLDIKVVLGLRKTCMDNLEAQGCKRTSVSSELGNWWKERSAQ